MALKITPQKHIAPRRDVKLEASIKQWLGFLVVKIITDVLWECSLPPSNFKRLFYANTSNNSVCMVSILTQLTLVSSQGAVPHPCSQVQQQWWPRNIRGEEPPRLGGAVRPDWDRKAHFNHQQTIPIRNARSDIPCWWLISVILY